MKILQVIPFFAPEFGGSVTVPYELSEELAKRKHDVTIITTDFGFNLQFADAIRSNGVHVIPFHCAAHFGLFLYTPSMKPWLEKNLKEFDIIHLHNYRSYQNVAVHTSAMKHKIPYIVQAHGSVLPFFEKQNLKKLFDFVWGDKILKDSSKVIAVSGIEREQYLKMQVSDNKIEIVPNGIDMSEYETLPDRGEFTNKYGIVPDEKIILYLGRLHKGKGLDFLVNGFSGLLDQRRDVRLVIIGPDEGFLDILMKQIIRLKIEENVLLLGPLYKTEKFEALVDADVLVYPGIFEIFGLVPFEAIMCGTPVIVAEGCGCGEIIKEANCGLIVKSGEVNQLIDHIENLINNPDISQNFVANGQEYINNVLNWKILIKQFEDIYDSCLKKPAVIH